MVSDDHEIALFAVQDVQAVIKNICNYIMGNQQSQKEQCAHIMKKQWWKEFQKGYKQLEDELEEDQEPVPRKSLASRIHEMMP